MSEANESVFLYLAVQYDKENGFTTWLDLFKKQVAELTPEINDLFKEINDGTVKINKIENYNDLFNDYDIIKSRKDLEKFFTTAYKGGDVSKKYQQWMIANGKATSQFSDFVNEAKSALGSMAVNWAIG